MNIENDRKVKGTIYAKEGIWSNVPIELLEEKCNITEIFIDKYTIYCCFDNPKDIVRLIYEDYTQKTEKQKRTIKEMTDDFEEILNNNKKGYIELQRQYKSNSLDFIISIDGGCVDGTCRKHEIYLQDEYFHYSYINEKLKRKINKWLKENNYDITYNDIMRKGMIKR